MHPTPTQPNGDGKRVAATLPIELGRSSGLVLVILGHEQRLVVVVVVSRQRAPGRAVSLYVLHVDDDFQARSCRLVIVSPQRLVAGRPKD